MCISRALFTFWLIALVPAWGAAESQTSGGHRAVLRDYLSRQVLSQAAVDHAEDDAGKPFSDWTRDDYAAFLSGLDLDTDDDLWTWSHLTGIPIVALRKEQEFFRRNAHLLADTAAADRMSAAQLKQLRSKYDGKKRQLVIRVADGPSLPVRSIASTAVRVLAITAQISHNEDFAEDRTSLEALGPYLLRPGDLAYRDEVVEGIRSLPLSFVKVLRGKAIYLSTRRGAGPEAIWNYASSDKYPGYAGMQPGVFLGRADGSTAEALVRALGRIIRETVLESGYFGLYAYPLQFPEFQKLNGERRRVFGRRRDRLPQTAHGYIRTEARTEATRNFVEHFLAYVTDRDFFRARATLEKGQGHPELMEKFEFMETLAERTPTTIERLSREHIARLDPELQREILEEYLSRFARKEVVVTEFLKEFGKSFPEFTEEDYARFMANLDLSRDDDLWRWSHVTDIPIVALNQRSNVFHMNAHLLESLEAANLMSWSDLHAIRTSQDPASGRLQLVGRDGRRLRIRDLPEGLVQSTETTRGVSHNQGFADDQLMPEALELNLLRLGELENREELNEGIRLLPLSVVKAHRGKAIYPTNRSKTGWAVTWRASNDKNLTYLGMRSGSFVERRRDPQRAAVPADALVDRAIGSLRGSSTDSLLHEVGHIIDHSVIGGRAGAASFPHQFPEFGKLLAEKNLVFGEGDSAVPQTDYGYISPYSKTNAQENFAEHFWAYIRNKEGFLVRARAEQSDGYPGLMSKFRFMETLIEHTPATMERLSAEFIVNRQSQRESENRDSQREALAEYRRRWDQKDAIVAGVEKKLGKPFRDLTREDYSWLMGGLDLNRDDDLWTWSHLTGIPIVALNRNSTFFYCNVHLLEDIKAAIAIPYQEIVKLKRGYDQANGLPTLHTAEGDALRLRDLPPGTVRLAARTGAFWHDEGYAEPRIVLEALAPYLLKLDEITNRQHITKGLLALPLPVVKAYRGKAIYLTTTPGRSYTVGMPVSNSLYNGFAGMQAGVFLDRNTGPLTTHNLVHEMGHIIDYTVIAGRYGRYLHPYQFPEFREAKTDKDRIFGAGDDEVPQTGHGYVSRYARSNAQESFAEHFAAYILKKDTFLRLAEEEQSAGHAELMEKYRFLETLLDRTPVTTHRLSPAYVERLAASGLTR